MTSKHKGSCLCNSIQYEVTGDPFTFVICHCNNCQRSTGSAFMANVFFKQNQVEMLQGGETLKHYRDYDTGSGVPIIRSFCPNCGSSMFITNDKNEYTIVEMGTIHGDVDWTPRRENFTERRKKWINGIVTNPKPRSKL